MNEVRPVSGSGRMDSSSSPHDVEQQPQRKRRRHSSASAMRASDAASSPHPPRELGHMRPGRVTGSSSFVGSGSGIHFVRTVRSSFAKYYPRGSEPVDDELVPGEDDRLQTQSSSLWGADEVQQSSISGGPATATPFEDMVRWSQAYFNNWHPPFPFLHAPSILALLEMVSLHGLSGLNSIESILVRSVLSTSLADRRQMPRDNQLSLVPSHLIFNTIEEAISGLSPILIKPSTLASLQAAVSIQVFLVSMLRLNAASRLGGTIVRIAFHLGLHRCPARFAQFSSADADMRRRLFWSIYCLERYLAQSLGLPLDLKDDDIDVCYPDNELHTRDDVSSSKFEPPHDPRLLYLPACLARHGRIKGLILELRNKSVFHSKSDPDEVAHVDAEISKWWNEAQDLLDPSYMNEYGVVDDPAGSNPTPDFLKPSHRLLLIVQKHESVILLNRPVITSGYNTSAFAGAMQKCIGASKAIVSKIYQHLHDGMKEAGSLEGRILSPLFWPGFTWCVWMSGLILLYAASEGHYSVQIALREADRCVKILENLAMRGNFWPGACVATIKDLQQALTSNIANNNSDQQENSPSSQLNDLQRSNIYDTDTQKRQGVCADLTGQTLPVKRASTSILQHRNNVRGIDLTQDSQLNQATPSTIISAPLETPSSQGNPSSSIRSHQLSSFPPIGPAYSDIWSGGMNGSSFYPTETQLAGSTDNQLVGFDDIFQLMDVSYHLSEHMRQAPDIGS